MIEYLETYIDKATDDTNDILNDLSAKIETISIDFISEIEKILDVLEKIYTIIQEHSLTHISTNIDNT